MGVPPIVLAMSDGELLGCTPPPGPSGDGGERLVTSFDLRVYPLEVVMAGAYLFIDRCYLVLDQTDDHTITVTLTARAGADAGTLPAIAGELQNELLSVALRQAVGQRHDKIRELVIARALFGAAPELAPSAGAALATEVDAGLVDVSALPADDDDYMQDPLGIGVPWEEKFVRPPPAGAAPGGEAATAAPSVPAPGDEAPPPAGDDPAVPPRGGGETNLR